MSKHLIQIIPRGHGKSWINNLMKDVLDLPLEKLILSEGKVYGARYYCVEPVGGVWIDMELWCLQTFGETSSIWQETKNLTPTPLKRWYTNNRKFWFRDPADRTLFLLKWN